MDSAYCGPGTFSGETQIRIDRADPFLALDKASIGDGVCVDKTLKVPFFSGNLNGEEIIMRTTSGGIQKLTEEEIRSGTFLFTPKKENYEYEIKFWLEAGSTRSDTIKVRLEDIPTDTGLTLWPYSGSFYDGETEVYQVLRGTSTSPSFYAQAPLGHFEINGTPYPPDKIYSYLSELFLSSVAGASDYTLNRVTNACGTFPVNEKYRIEVKDAWCRWRM
ncbi:MAG: hypothetical protein LRY55_11630 [Leadbetterella sp.]|nr:hypothetical protein [Leadbetterella sp.]